MLEFLDNKEEWKTKDGRTIKIRDLESFHLINIIRFLRKRAEGIKLAMELDLLSFSTAMMGDAAQDALENEQWALSDTPADDVLEDTPLYQALIKEAKRRGYRVIE